MLQIFGLLSGLVSIVAFIPYIKDILKGSSKPERASWLIWMVLGSIAFFSQLAKGATDSLWLTGVQSLGVVVIFILAIKYGVGGLVRRDIISLILAGFGLILWFVTKDAAAALLIVIAIDSLGAYLTAVKAYHEPDSEALIPWFLFGLAGVFGALAVGEIKPILIVYPFYIVLANLAVVIALFLGAKKKKTAIKL